MRVALPSGRTRVVPERCPSCRRYAVWRHVKRRLRWRCLPGTLLPSSLVLTIMLVTINSIISLVYSFYARTNELIPGLFKKTNHSLSSLALIVFIYCNPCTAWLRIFLIWKQTLQMFMNCLFDVVIFDLLLVSTPSFTNDEAGTVCEFDIGRVKLLDSAAVLFNGIKES